MRGGVGYVFFGGVDGGGFVVGMEVGGGAVELMLWRVFGCFE